jgi:hypothetical protein
MPPPKPGTGRKYLEIAMIDIPALIEKHQLKPTTELLALIEDVITQMLRPANCKMCPSCGTGYLIPFTSDNERQCCDCGVIFEFKLKPGQKSLHIKNLKG